jgi:PKHD-type hydroxylase
MAVDHNGGVILQIPEMLKHSELEALRAELRRSTFEDGAATAGPIAREVKRNLQLPPASEASRRCAPIILEALRRNPTFFSASLPLRVHGPVFNRYEAGMTYGEHVDNALMGNTNPVRADLSATLFLSGAEEYEGGDLVVHDSVGAHRVKLPAGSLVLYPGNTVHEVTPVSRGMRLAAVLWIQSMVRDEAQRRILFELDLALGGLRQKLPAAGELNTLTATYHNLLRLWSET